MYEKKKFRKSLFGYSRTDVSEYLNTLSEEFSARLLEQEQQAKQETDKLQGKIEQLELENKKLLERHLEVANALLNAEKYNSCIKEAVETEAQKLYDGLVLKVRHETEKLNTYKQSISQLKESVQTVLDKISIEIDAIAREAEVVEILDFSEIAIVINSERNKSQVRPLDDK